MIEELERLTREYFDEDETSTHLDYAIAQIESGIPIASIARTIGEGTGLDIQRQVLSRYLHDLSPDAADRITAARPAMTQAMAEDAITIIDQSPNDKLDLAHNAAKARTRENIAKMLNPEFQSTKQQTNVQFNIGAMHLTALRQPILAPHARVSLPAELTEGRVTVAGS